MARLLPLLYSFSFYRRVATFTILHRFCRILHFYHFTPKVANFYRTLTLCRTNLQLHLRAHARNRPIRTPHDAPQLVL